MKDIIVFAVKDKVNPTSSELRLVHLDVSKIGVYIETENGAFRMPIENIPTFLTNFEYIGEL